jgi:cell wall assembly regulator SMI1
MVPSLIGRMDRWLAANRPDYHARLQPGLPDAALDAFEARFSLALPEAFRLFYRWRNGQEPACEASFQGNRRFSPLEEIAATKDLLDGMIGSDFDDPRWWRRGWVPFLGNGGGDHLCLDLGPEAGGPPGRVIAFWHDWEDRSVRSPSFETWLLDLVASMEDGRLELS